MKAEMIQCNSCNKSFDLDSDKFFTVSGNIYKGLTGGLIGSGFEDRQDNRHYCKRCMIEALYLTLDDFAGESYLDEHYREVFRDSKMAQLVKLGED